jgi:carboxypeptidase Taq
MKKDISELKDKLLELYHLNSAIAVLSWDQEVNMPQKGAEMRAQTIANLAGILHEKFTSKNFSLILKKINNKAKESRLNDEEKCIIREVNREYAREKKLPLEFVKELVKLCSQGQSVWAEARRKSDFKIFAPYLKKIVDLKRKEAKLVGYKKSPYDALLDTYEPRMTSEDISLLFNDLKDFLVPFIERIKNSKIKEKSQLLKGDYPIEEQIKFNEVIARKIGFDFESGRLDTSAHTFTMGFHPQDVRITTRYEKDDLFHALSATIHEAGHALYEQGILIENFGSPLGDSISLGIHESQSRIWENIVGKNISFWKYFYLILQKEFPVPFKKISLELFYKAINSVSPSLIRIEADEVTYNLHVIMRFEIEKELIEGSIEVNDLPKIWKSKMKEYFGLKVPNDAQGVLQDIHWSGGSIGYFPTYTLGNLYSAQFYEAAKRDIPDLEKRFGRGEFIRFREWLKKNIHIHGKIYSADALVKEITGEPLSSNYFINYIRNKYSRIYNLK